MRRDARLDYHRPKCPLFANATRYEPGRLEEPVLRKCSNAFISINTFAYHGALLEENGHAEGAREIISSYARFTFDIRENVSRLGSPCLKQRDTNFYLISAANDSRNIII